MSSQMQNSSTLFTIAASARARKAAQGVVDKGNNLLFVLLILSLI
jgi:hypothetical protein